MSVSIRRKEVAVRLKSGRDNVRSSIGQLREYIEVFNDRFAFIQRGMSCLRINPPKVSITSELQSVRLRGLELLRKKFLPALLWATRHP